MILGAVLVLPHLAKPTEETRGNSVGNIVNEGLVASQGDWIYYTNMDKDDDGKRYFELYKVRTDGSGRTRINGDAAGYLNVVGDWLYYVSGKVDEESYFGFNFDGIYRVRTDGSEHTLVCQDYYGYLNVVDGWIYYYGGTLDDDFGIYEVRTDGSGRTKLNDDGAIPLNVIGDWIYYNYINHESNEYGFYKVRTDGSRREAIYSFPCCERGVNCVLLQKLWRRDYAGRSILSKLWAGS